MGCSMYHSLIFLILNSYDLHISNHLYFPGTVLCTGDTVVNKIQSFACKDLIIFLKAQIWIKGRG